jgi:hypothetical protein
MLKHTTISNEAPGRGDCGIKSAVHLQNNNENVKEESLLTQHVPMKLLSKMTQALSSMIYLKATVQL